MGEVKKTKQIEVGQYWEGVNGEVFHVKRRRTQVYLVVNEVSPSGRYYRYKRVHEDSFSREITLEQAEIIANISFQKGIKVFLRTGGVS